MLRSNKWIASQCGDSTLVVFVPGHQDVTFHSPASSPGVLDQPVVLALVSSITNNKYSVVQKPRAVAVTEIRKVRIRLASRVLPTMETEI